MTDREYLDKRFEELRYDIASLRSALQESDYKQSAMEADIAWLKGFTKLAITSMIALVGSVIMLYLKGI